MYVSQKGSKQQTWSSRLIKVIGIDANQYYTHVYDFILLFNSKYLALFPDIISYFHKIKEVTWTWVLSG